VHLAHLAPEHVTVIVGFTIALHVFGMYGLSPVFGILADRWGRIRTVLLGQGILIASLVTAAVAPDDQWAVLVALFLLGLGWSAATVAGAALLTESTVTAMRPRRQGVSDTVMTLSAAVGAVLAGVVLGAIGYGGLALTALVIVVAVVALSPYARR
jgi:MFS family permease